MIIGSMNRDELIKLGNKLLNCESEEESDELYELFNKQFNHPDAANLFYYPENYNARDNDISEYEPTVEEVIDLAASYQAIML